jgi:RNA polymerase sigma-70 factor, ECF subfamily
VDDRSGFVDLFEEEYGQLHRVAFLIVDDDGVAHEVVQEAFTRALVRWRRLARYDKPGAWLRTVVVRLALRARDQRRVAAPTAPTEVGREDPADHADLLAAVRALGRTDRAVVVLHYLCDLPVAEVAELVRATPGAVRVRLHRARARLADTLGEETEDVRS